MQTGTQRNSVTCPRPRDPYMPELGPSQVSWASTKTQCFCFRNVLLTLYVKLMYDADLCSV